MIQSSKLDEILFLGKYEYEFSVKEHSIIFNLCNAGEEQDSINLSRGGEINNKAAVMAASLVSVDGYRFMGKSDSESFVEKYRFLRHLKKPLFDHFWDQYSTAVALQYKDFEEFMSKDMAELKNL